MMLGYDLPLQAGLELDALVAEKVMGWRKQHDAYNWRWSRDLVLRSEDRFVASWHPSTDIGSAWEVVEKMAAPGFKVWINCSGAGTFDVEVSVLGDDTRWHVIAEECDCETAPLGICLAALAAIGEVR